MKKIKNLYKAFVLYTYKLEKIETCINWAVERLENDEEEGDNNIILLAGETDPTEASNLTKRILEKYLPTATNNEVMCGKYIIELYRKYHEGEIDIHELDSIILKLYNGLNYPDWLVMLSRNCEYATDIDAFQKPFEDEFKYIVGLWEETDSIKEFYDKYDRAVSNSHNL
jgi:hypothetical protein